MRIKETKVYTFDELTEAAKEKARDWLREASAGDTFFSEAIIEDFAIVAGFCGWDINTKPVKLMNGSTRHDPAVYWSLGYSQSDYAHFEGRFSTSRVDSTKLKAHAPQDAELHALADRFAALAATHPELSASVRSSDRYGPQFDISEETDDGDVLSADTETELKEASRSLMQWLYSALRRENDYQNADEQVDETIRANEYEFTEDGRRA